MLSLFKTCELLLLVSIRLEGYEDQEMNGE